MMTLQQDSDGTDENEDKEDEDDDNGNENRQCNVNDTDVEETVDNEYENEGACEEERSRVILQTASGPITAATYAALITPTSNDYVDSARSVIRVPAQRPNLPQLTLGTSFSTSSNISPISTALFSAGSTTQIGTEFSPWGLYRPFSATLPGYLPLQAGFLGPKFGGKLIICRLTLYFLDA